MTTQFSGSTSATNVEWVGIDHVQMAIPGGEQALATARSFYVDAMGLTEVPKPAVMAARGGAWFEAGPVKVHVGADPDFVPARKAHPALTMRGLEDFVDERDLEATWNSEIEGVVRCFVADPFGNRIELIDAGTLYAPGTGAGQ